MSQRILLQEKELGLPTDDADVDYTFASVGNLVSSQASCPPPRKYSVSFSMLPVVPTAPPLNSHVAVLPSSLVLRDDTVAQSCSNGLAGVESTSYDVCCSIECTTCGGTGCALQNTTNGAADCCVTEIYDSGVLCVDSGEAPCIMTTGESSLVRVVRFLCRLPCRGRRRRARDTRGSGPLPTYPRCGKRAKEERPRLPCLCPHEFLAARVPGGLWNVLGEKTRIDRRSSRQAPARVLLLPHAPV